MKRIAALAILVFLSSLFVACSTVKMKQSLPKSEMPKVFMETFEGCWILSGSSVCVGITSDSVGHIAWTEWKDNQFKINTGEFILTRGKNGDYLSLRCLDDGKWSDWSFVRIQFLTDIDALIISPDLDVLIEALTKNILKGNDSGKKPLGGRDVLLSSDPQKILEFIDGEKSANIFNSKESGVAHKLVMPPSVKLTNKELN